MTSERVFQPAPMATSVVGSHARPGWLDLVMLKHAVALISSCLGVQVCTPLFRLFRCPHV